MNATIEMPKTVRKLKADQIADGLYGKDDQCLIGHGVDAFGAGLVFGKFEQAALEEMATERISYLADYVTEKGASASADLWNRTMLKLGYIDAGDHFELPEGVR